MIPAIALNSCSDDILGDETPLTGTPADNICFGISDDGDWTESRGGRQDSGDSVVSRFVLRNDRNAADTLCAVMTVGNFDGNGSAMSRASLASTDRMHSSFGVSGYLSAMASPGWNIYFNNEQNVQPATSGQAWTYASGKTYYWPGSDYEMRFFAYAPYQCEGLRFNPNSDGLPTLTYTVPEAIDQQTDLLSTTVTTDGDYYQVIGLKFDHICTAVQFVIGDDMQPGSIKRISLKGVYVNGTYSGDTRDWTLNTAVTRDFSHYNIDLTTSGDASETGTAITGDTQCFVMLPQVLPQDAAIEIEFQDDVTGTTRVLSAKIGGLTWPKGALVKYHLSIKPDYQLDITNLPPIQDAHYVICSATVNADNLPAGRKWTITASTQDGSRVTMLTTLNSYQQAGFWTDRLLDAENNQDIGSARGEPTLTDTGSKEVYIFLPENNGDADREVTLSICVDGFPGTTVQKKIYQHYPDRTASGLGWEWDEEDPQSPWGFLWERRVTFVKRNIWGNFLIVPAIIEYMIDNYNASNYAEITKRPANILQVGTVMTTVVLDYGKLNSLSGLTLTTDDGLTNTRNLHTYSGGATTGNLENALRNWKMSGEPMFNETVTGTNNNTSAALGYVLKKNRYNMAHSERTEGGKTTVTEYPILNADDIVWYLPARDQFTTPPPTVLLDGSDYWSSTPYGNDRAYTNGGSQGRMSNGRIRACRNR